jgi:hypothetical protein
MISLEMERPGLAETKSVTNTEATGAGLGMRSHETGPNRVNDPSREPRKEHSGEREEQRSNLRGVRQAG